MNITAISAAWRTHVRPALKQTILVMKLTTILLIITLLHTSAKSFSQQINLHEISAPLEKIVSAISQQSGYEFIYTDQQLKNEKISVRISNASLTEALKACFEPINIDYKLVGKNIVLAKKEQRIPIKPGRLTGTVTDKKGYPLVGVTIGVAGQSKGTQSQNDGTYGFSLQPGTYTIQASYIGYKTHTFENVKINDSQATTLNIILEAGENALTEVMISGSFRASPTLHTNEREIVELIQKAPTIVSAISNEQIVKSFDRSSAEVMRRFAGITLSDNRFIQVRGMDPRYAVTFLNGLPAPSAESDRRSFSYDMITSNVIDRIISYKSQSPELYSELSGGLVNISTKHAVDKKQLEVQVSSQYRPGSTGEDFITYGGSKWDFLASGANDRDMPKDVPKPDNELGTLIPDAIGKRIVKPNFNMRTITARPDIRFSLTYLDKLKIGKEYLNSISMLNYTNAKTQTAPVLQRRNAAISGIDPSYLQYHFYNEGVAVTGMQNFMYPLNRKVTFEWKNLYTRNANDEVSTTDGLVLYRYGGRTVFNQYTQRSLYTTQFSTNIMLNEDGTTSLNAIAGYAYTSERIPGQRDQLYSNYLNTYVIPSDPSGKITMPWELNPIDTSGYYGVTFFQGKNGTSAANTGISRNAMRYYNTGERAWSGTVNFNTDFPRGIKLLAGGFMELRNRDNSARTIAIRTTDAGMGDLYTGNTYKPFERLSDWINPAHIGNGLTLLDINLAASGYNANSKVFAGYATATVPLLKDKLVFYGGLRADYNRYTVQNLRPDGTPLPRLNPQTNERDTVNTALDVNKLYWLPSLNVTWHATTKLQFRASYGKSINRPEFRESAEVVYYDTRIDANIFGNSNLKFAELDNYDFRAEYYPAEGQQWAVGGYYKKIKNAIERYSFAASNFENDAIGYRNTPKSKAYGIEAEFRQSLRFIPWNVMRYFSVIANGSYLFTETIRRSGPEETKYETASEKRPMQGATPYLINTGLYFDRSRSGTSVALLCNITGQKLAIVGGTFNADYYEIGRTTLDISITQRINKNITLRAGVQDLLNQPIQIGRDADGNNRYDKNGKIARANNAEVQDYIENTFKRGAYYSFGFNFKF